MAPAPKKKPKAAPRKKKPATAKMPAAKMPVALVRGLADALGRDGEAYQVGGLAEKLAPLGDAKAAAAARAVLAHTRKGAPLARAYLKALVEDDASEAANEVVRFCATMERGRKFLRPAFAAVWRKATDIAALDTACKNFARGLLDDPALLDAAVDAAAKLGDAAGAAQLAGRLERAQRLAPLLERLAGAAPERARGRGEVAALSQPDRWHVYARVVDSPRRYDEDIAVDAVIALMDDPQVADMALTPAIIDMRYHGGSALVAKWKARVAAGDSALITRLLGLFEWTSLWATDDEQLEPFIQALLPAGKRPEVFASVEHALAGTSAVAREAVLEGWLREREGIRAFDDAQVDKLVRMAVTIAEAGDNTNDRKAANRALCCAPHPGARHALMDAVRNASTLKNDELRRNLYFGLSSFSHADVLPFLVERMFVEREEYSALLHAIGTHLDHAGHVRVLATLVERAAEPDAIHAATVYADTLLYEKKSPRLLIDLARCVIGWQATTNDDARRLRYLFEQATAAALQLMRPDDARAFLARARVLTDSTYSDYRVKARDEKTPTIFGESATKKKIAALDAGKLDQQIAKVRAEADAARAAGTPIDADDARLGTLAGCTVSARFFVEPDTHVVWFFDEVGALHVYDGYNVAQPAFAVSGTGGESMSPTAMVEFIGAPNAEGFTPTLGIDERALFIDAKAARVRELISLGDRLLVFDGTGRDMWDRISLTALGLKFGTPAEARHTFGRLAATAQQVDPWYVEGAGAVRRTYYCPLPDGGYNEDGSARCAVLGKTIDAAIDRRCPELDRVFATSDAAVDAMEAWEMRVFAAGGLATELWIDREATRPEDTLVSAFLDQRYRDDDQTAAWHLQALGEMFGAIAEAGLAPLVPDVHVTVGPPASDTDIAAYQALVPEPLPEPLVEVWREVGAAGFASTEMTARFLSPSELVSRRAELRASLQTFIQTKLKGAQRKAKLAMIADLDVLALRDDKPLIVFDTRQRQRDGRCFCSADSDWWEKALGWQIATDINVLFHKELQTRLPDVFRLKLGQRASDTTRRAHLEKAGKIWEAVVDGAQVLVRTSGKTLFKPTIKQLASPAAAAKAFDNAVAAARKKGFR